MITSIRIGHIKSFAAPQSIDLARPSGQRGSGYNVLVGQNNTGKSTLVTMARHLLSNNDSITVGQEARREPTKPVIEVTWQDNEGTEKIGIDTNIEGAIFKKVGNRNRTYAKIRFVPSRRPFASDYNANQPMRASEYEFNELSSRMGNPSHFDGYLATSIATLFGDPALKAAFIKQLAKVDPATATFTTDNVGGRNVLLYTGPSKRPHVIADTGDGITNLIRIIYALVTSEPDSCIIIDEPELSLHPQLQRNLFSLLVAYTSDRQILVVTHSPHFVGWNDISGAARLFRVYISSEGNSVIASPSPESFAAVKAHSNITSRKYYDAVCKELFFADKAVLVEGPDDVHYIENYLETKQQAPLPLMGYGCGGATVITPWVRLCLDMGIKCAALFDGDKKQDYEAAVQEFRERSQMARCFLLFKDDIRDKHKRDEAGRETKDIIKQGVFRRNGRIHADAEDRLVALISHIRSFLVR